MKERTNDEWLHDLRSPERDQALADLQTILSRGLYFAVARQYGVTDADVQDFVQDALLRILNALETFRGESRFTTWAQKIAVRVALTELRRRRWRDVSLEDVTQEAENADFIPAVLADSAGGPEKLAEQNALLGVLRQMILSELTQKQRQALVAVGVHGMPLEEVAHRMNTNRNALYKLLHDARQKLKRRMLVEGFTVDEMLATFES